MKGCALSNKQRLRLHQPDNRLKVEVSAYRLAALARRPAGDLQRFLHIRGGHRGGSVEYNQ